MVSNHQSAVDSLIYGYLWDHNFRVRAQAAAARLHPHLYEWSSFVTILTYCMPSNPSSPCVLRVFVLRLQASFKHDLMFVPGIGTAMWIAGYVPVKRGDKASGQR